MTNTPVDIPGWKHVYSGKVRDLYIPLEDTQDAVGVNLSDDA